MKALCALTMMPYDIESSTTDPTTVSVRSWRLNAARHGLLALLTAAALFNPDFTCAQAAIEPGSSTQNTKSSGTLRISAEKARRVDAYADATPASATATLPRLAYYLSGAGDDELSRARAVFRWVTRNIEYDNATALSGRAGDQRAETVFQRRRAASEGFANLVQEIGTTMGLKVQTVTGWSKGLDYANGENLKQTPNHAWNVVSVDGRWHLMDAAWGSGFMDSETRFVAQFQPHYFLTPPEQFAVDHFPGDTRWQLTSTPVSVNEFANAPYLRPAFWQTGLKVISPARLNIRSTGRAQVTLGTTQPITLVAQLYSKDGKLIEQPGLTLVQYGAGTVRLDIALPKAGQYVLRVLAKPVERDGELDWVMDYRINASAGLADAGFPKVFNAFNQRNVTLHEPMAGHLDSGQAHTFRIRVPNAKRVAVVNGDQWQFLDADGDEWVGNIVTGDGDIKVMANYGNGDQFTGLLKYNGR